MSKGLEALENHKLVLKALGHKNCEDWENLKDIEKELKALDIFKEHELADTLFSYLKGDKTPDDWNWGLPKKMQVTQEEWDLLREVIYGKDRVGD